MATFATPLPQSPRSQVLEWRFPRPHHQYVLTGRSRAAWQTSFVIPQLSLLLDAGLCVNKLRPRHVFLTHGHSDHTLLLPAFARPEDPPDVFCPAEMRDALDDFVRASARLNLGGEADLVGGGGSGGAEGRPEEADGNGTLALGGTHASYGLRAGDEVTLGRLKGSAGSGTGTGTGAVVTARAFTCDHSVPCLGYVFSMMTRGLRAELAGLRGEEIRELRAGGIEVTETRTRAVFAFLGDGTAATLAAEPGWLRDGIPVVITECSFLYEEHAEMARRTKHTLWRDLQPVVRRWPRTTFVLMHFSLRYGDEDIRRFFKDMRDPPENIVIWVDGEAGDDGKDKALR